MWRIYLILLALLLIPGSMPVLLAHAAPLQLNDTVSHLWLDISLGPPLVTWFNRVARPNDIARVEHIREIGLLDEVTVGRRLVVFKSVAEAERFVPVIADRIDIIGYNLEQGPFNPASDQADPVGSVMRMHDLAQEYDLKLAFGPDHRFAESDGVAVAPYVDIMVLQVQRVQTEPATVVDFTMPLIQGLRRANPDLNVSVQVRTEGDVVALVDLVDSIRDDLDGVSILTSPETVDIAEDLVTELRKVRRPTPVPVATTAPLAAAEVGAGSAEPVESTESDVGPVSIQNISPPQRTTIVSAIAAGALAGAVAGGLMAALICVLGRRAANE